MQENYAFPEPAHVAGMAQDSMHDPSKGVGKEISLYEDSVSAADSWNEILPNGDPPLLVLWGAE